MEKEAETFFKLFTAYNPTAAAGGGSTDAQLIRAADTLWQAATSPGSFGTAGSKSQGIDIGRSVLSDNEKWKLQAAMRREETTKGGKEYNKKLLRPTKNTKGPTPGEGFPAGRGRPLK